MTCAKDEKRIHLLLLVFSKKKKKKTFVSLYFIGKSNTSLRIRNSILLDSWTEILRQVKYQ